MSKVVSLGGITSLPWKLLGVSGGVAVQEERVEEGEENGKGLSRPQSTPRRGTTSPAAGGLGAAIWRARQPLPHCSARVRAGAGRGGGASPILRSNKHKYTEIIHGSGDLSRCLVSIC